MAHLGTLQNYRFSEEQAPYGDIRGASVYGRNEEKLGKIDDVIFDHSTGQVRYIVVDTGWWLSSRKFLVPPQQLHQSARHKDDFAADLDKKQIESFPPYAESDIHSEDRWRDYENRYHAAWVNGPVQHRTGSDHDVTPTDDEMPPAANSIGSQISEEENRRPSERIIPAGADEITIQDGPAGIGSRWLTFESLLRQHYRDLTIDCPSCDDESAVPERKAG